MFIKRPVTGCLHINDAGSSNNRYVRSSLPPTASFYLGYLFINITHRVPNLTLIN